MSLKLPANLKENISSSEAFKIIQDNSNDPSMVIMDVRTPDEFKTGHIKGAVNINFLNDDFEKNIKPLDKTKVYLIYCRSGHRAGNALKVFKKLGFKNAYNFGGIIDWQNAGYELVN